MRITQEADYALRITYTLAANGRRMDARSIAAATGVPERFTVKILRKLNLGGLIRSQKGVAGGYVLNLPPQEISMRRVVEIIDGPLLLSRCLEDSYECSRTGACKKSCTFHRIFEKLNETLLEKLDQVTLDTVIDEGIPTEEILSKI